MASVIISSSDSTNVGVANQNLVDNFVVNFEVNVNVDVIAVLGYIVVIMLTTASSWITVIYTF
jgi:hypothetical protein